MTAITYTDAVAKARLVPIQVRKMDFDFSDNVPRYWLDNDPVKSHFFSALAYMFPVGERFFIDSIRYYQPEITDLELQKNVRAFIGQEAIHAQMHERWNKLLDNQGYTGLKKVEAKQIRRIEWFKRRLLPQSLLAATVSIEHCTAILARYLLNNPDKYLDKMHPEMRKLWLWHAVEEAEHKSVAFDVYQNVCGQKKQLNRSFIIITIRLMLTMLAGLVSMYKQDGLVYKVSIWVQTVQLFWGIRQAIKKDWQAFFKKDFHPWKTDDNTLIEKWKGMIENPL